MSGMKMSTELTSPLPCFPDSKAQALMGALGRLPQREQGFVVLLELGVIPFHLPKSDVQMNLADLFEASCHGPQNGHLMVDSMEPGSVSKGS
jgi:hypothetical protein